MPDSTTDESTENEVASDGGVETADYLDARINILDPATPFMRDHLQVLWVSFFCWVLFVFGPVTATAIAPGLMTETIVLGFQLHFLLTAIVAPLGALLLSTFYAWRRDRLDEKYGIAHDRGTDEPAAAAADGGETE